MVSSDLGVRFNVIEGFVSFKTRRSNHSADALALLKAISDPDTAEIYGVRASPGEQCVNMLSLSGVVPPTEPCPTVAVVKV